MEIYPLVYVDIKANKSKSQAQSCHSFLAKRFGTF
jgi:hypothetical protein